jgi:hypothetical protein
MLNDGFWILNEVELCAAMVNFELWIFDSEE